MKIKHWWCILKKTLSLLYLLFFFYLSLLYLLFFVIKYKKKKHCFIYFEPEIIPTLVPVIIFSISTMPTTHLENLTNSSNNINFAQNFTNLNENNLIQCTNIFQNLVNNTNNISSKQNLKSFYLNISANLTHQLNFQSTKNDSLIPLHFKNLIFKNLSNITTHIINETNPIINLNTTKMEDIIQNYLTNSHDISFNYTDLNLNNKSNFTTIDHIISHPICFVPSTTSSLPQNLNILV